MALENKAYVPTLALRPSEMNGLEYLPGASKDRLTPCFLLAPWANANLLERAITRIERAYPNRDYILDIDRDYQTNNVLGGPQIELQKLLDPSNCYANWVSFCAEHPHVIPCIQTPGQSEKQLITQIESIQGLGRNYCVRIYNGHNTGSINDIVGSLNSIGTSDFSIILEGGWTNDALSLNTWFNGIISASLSSVDAQIPIILSCTSMPSEFSGYNGPSPSRVSFTNRQLLQQVAKNTNRQRLIYGDWGSTKPRRYGSMARHPLDRIDYPTDEAWIIARNKDDDWTFREAAMAIVNSPDWSGDLHIWGEEMILNTIVNEEIGINSAQKNVAARVNIHLHRQAFFGDATGHTILEENWQD